MSYPTVSPALIGTLSPFPSLRWNSSQVTTFEVIEMYQEYVDRRASQVAHCLLLMLKSASLLLCIAPS